MIFKSLVWIAIAAAGSVASADNANQVIDDDIKSIKAAQKVSEWDLPGFTEVVISPKINLKQFHPPAELLPKSGVPVALIFLCKPGKFGNLTQIERQGDVIVHPWEYEQYMILKHTRMQGYKDVRKPKTVSRTSLPISLNNAYYKYPECRVYWNGEVIFNESVVVKIKPTFEMKYSGELPKEMKKDCKIKRHATPLSYRTVDHEKEVHAYKKDGKSDPMATYLINYLLNDRHVRVFKDNRHTPYHTLIRKLNRVINVAKEDDKEICHRIASLPREKNTS